MAGNIEVTDNDVGSIINECSNQAYYMTNHIMNTKGY